MINLENDYTCEIFDCSITQKIGEQDKTKRVCRFCEKREPDVCFRTVAHAISEGLGNENIILNEECDTCNLENGKLEQSFIDWFHFYRVMYSISKRDGRIPTYQSSSGSPILSIHSLQYEIENQEDFQKRYVQHVSITSKIKAFASNLCCLRIKTNSYDELCEYYLETETEIRISMPNKNIVYSDAYKGLLKYFISCIPSDQLQILTKTKELFSMSNEHITDKKLYLIIESQEEQLEVPQLKIYTRQQTASDTLPCMIGEFLLAQLKLTLIIPCDNDETDFTNSTEQDYKDLFSYIPNINITNFAHTGRSSVSQQLILNNDPATYTPIIKLFEDKPNRKNEMFCVMNMHSEPTKWDIGLWIEK